MSTANDTLPADSVNPTAANPEPAPLTETTAAEHDAAHAHYHARRHEPKYEDWDNKVVPTVANHKNEAYSIDIEGEDGVDGRVTKKQSNTYAAKKTVAQGMMDIALITANANQLRYIIEFNRNSSTFYINIVLIVISLLLQVAVGISLIFKGRFDLRGQSKHAHAKRINNYVVVAVFLVTIINVFIASFTITGGGNLATAIDTGTPLVNIPAGNGVA